MANAATHLVMHAFGGRWTGWLALILGVVLAAGVLMVAGGVEFTGSQTMTEPIMAP